MNPLNHTASVDEDGNILLPQEGSVMQEGVWYQPQAARIVERTESWEIIDEPLPIAPVEHVWSTARDQIEETMSRQLEESARQYRMSFQNAGSIAVESWSVTKNGMTRAWSFLTQPVWIPNRKREPVQYSRGALFMLDTVRFGGTFAFLFVALFVSLNYQSFWAIAQSYVSPLAEVTGIAMPTARDRSIAEKLKRIPSLTVAGESENGMIEYLPLVGPPDNRLIIPKLNLNVPITVPPNDALMREDWKALEDDIQKSLHDGVVHYPGTARPGQPGNFFVTGHSSYFPWDSGKYKSVFARLGELKEGDEYWVFYNGDRYRYIVSSKKEIKPADVTVLDQPVNKRISTLMTCTPIGTTLRRLIISAREVDPITGEPLEVGEHAEQQLPQVKMEMLPI